MSDQFTIFAYDINTNTKLTELPGLGLSFSSRLNDAGSIGFSLPLGRAGIAKLVQPLLDYDGIPIKLYVDRDGIIQGSGFIAWTGAYDNQSKMLPVGGKELRSWAAKRTQAADYSPASFATIDPGVLVFKALTDAQNPALAGAGASIGLQIVNSSAGLTAIVPGYPQSQYTFVDSIVRDMANILQLGVGGLDTYWSSAWDPTTGAPVDTVTILTPRVGRSGAQTGLIFNLDDAIDYTWPTDATKMATTYGVTGSGSGDALPVAFANGPLPVGGIGQPPRLDAMGSSQSQSQSQVTLMAASGAQQFGYPVPTPTVTVPTAAPGQPLGSWIVGDDARLYTAGDERFPNGKDVFLRIVNQDVAVPDEGVATVTLTFNTPPQY